jgi:large subunit ribosomal protein L21
MSYAVISIGSKQYRVREGQRLLVDRVPHDEGKTFHPDVLLLGGDGDPKLGSDLEGRQVTAKVDAHVLGEKVVIGKHRRRTGYKRRRGFRAHLSRIEIQAIGAVRATRGTAAKKEPAAETAAKKPATRRPAARKSAATGAAAGAGEKKAPARKRAPRKKTEES